MARNQSLILFIVVAALAIAGCEKTVRQDNGFLAGTVTVDGIGVSGATISVFSYSSSTGNPKLSSGLAEGVAAAGGYRIELLSGEYRIEFDLFLDGEHLHTARYPVRVDVGVETVVNVELKDLVPRNLLARDDDVSVILTWEHAYKASKYNIYRALASDEIFNQVAVADSAFGTVQFIDTPPEIDAYLYKVTAISGQGESQPSDVVSVNFTASISPPTNFSASDYITHVMLQWTPKNNASLYKIFRAVNSSPNSWTVIDSTTQYTFQDSPENYDIFLYYVTAVSFLGTESVPSPVRSVNFDGRFDPPSGVILIDRGSNLYLTWLPQENIACYNIYRSQDPHGEFSQIDSSLVPYFEDFPLTYGYYYYGVTIVGPNDFESEMSDIVNAYYDGRLEPPDQVLATDLGLSVEVSWSRVLWTAAYIVYRSDDGGVTYNQISQVART
jgi:fibronectin type 3 domain-containing protein